MFFSFDGLDGVGKTTQIERFCDWLRQAGHDVVTCRDPGSTPLGEMLRSLLLDADGPAIGRRSETLIYMAARAQLVEQVIRPALDAGQTVVCDRFLLSNVVYQAHAGGLDADDVWNVGRFAVNGTMPDLVLLLDLSVEEACRRRGRAADRIERRGVEYLQRVREGYLAEARRDPEHIAVIDAARSPEDIHRDIQRIARPLVFGQRDVSE